MPDRRIALVALILTVGSIALLWLTQVPLGVPGEWEWRRIGAEGAQLREGVVGAVTAAIGASLYLAVVWLGAKRLVDCARLETATWLSVLVCGGFVWLWALQQSPTESNRLQKAAFVLYYRGSSGYFHEARYAMDSTADFLAGYEDKMREGDVLHVGTHPPGLFLAHRGLIRLCEKFPTLTAFLNQTQPREVDEMFDGIERHNQLLPRDRAAIWLASLLTQFIGVAALLPIFWLARLEHSREASWLASSLWPLVPALAVFLPKSDALYPFIGMAFLFCWHLGFRKQSLVLAFLAGVCLWCGMFLSLALMPVVALAGLWTIWSLFAGQSEDMHQRTWRALIKPVASVAVGFSVGVIVLWVAFDFDSFTVWWLNYQNHAGFYDQYQRTYWRWLPVNVFELSYGVGVPVMVLSAAAAWRVWSCDDSRRLKRLGPYVCCAAVWTLLWISGKNMGEAARLWLVIMPWPIWLSAAYFDVASERPKEPAMAADDGALTLWLPFGLLQAIICAATVLSVSGFEI